MAALLQFFAFSVDYSRTEYTQFEDDDYYYYVKAVPKLAVTRPEPKVQFTLYCNGKPYYMATQPEKDAYGRYTYRHLPAKVDGELAEYTVRVDSLPGYLVSYENRGTYAGLTDGAYEDGSVLARHVPLTGEPRHPWAQTGLITGVLGAAAAIALLSKRKQMD